MYINLEWLDFPTSWQRQKPNQIFLMTEGVNKHFLNILGKTQKKYLRLPGQVSCVEEDSNATLNRPGLARPWIWALQWCNLTIRWQEPPKSKLKLKKIFRRFG
jgi:hypothetical protein